MRRAARALVVTASVGTLGVACNAILGLEPPPSPDGGPGTGGGAGGDAGPAPVCAALDAGLAGDATVDPGAYAALGPLTLADAGGSWDFFDMSALAVGTPNFLGGTFDGRYVYFSPRGSSVVRYDTKAGAFDQASSWEAFNLSQAAPPLPGGYSGALYDGRFVYFVPYQSSSATPSVIARFDACCGNKLADKAAWSSFDLTTIKGISADAGVPWFYGGAFDGKNLYLVPHNNGAGVPDGRILRYAVPDAGALPDAGDAGALPDAGDAGHPADGGGDAGAGDAGPGDGGDAGMGDGGDAGNGGFEDAGPWTEFDLSTLDVQAVGFAGGVFDGTSLYLVPNVNGAFGDAVHGGQNATVARLKVSSSFTTASSWSLFDTTNVDALAYNFVGAGFDGRYVYLAPHADAVVVRFDTSAGAIGTPSAWSAYDLTRVVETDAASVGYSGVAFDGRFVYFIPSSASFGQLVRYDTLSTFTADCAWSTVDLTTVTPPKGPPGAYAGAIFDGQYLYLVPESGTYLAARFQARAPASMPRLPAFHGSFW